MPGEGLTRGPPAKQKAGGSYHRFSQIIRHSLRDGFNAYVVLSPGTGLSCSCRKQIVLLTWPQRREARTTRFHVRIGAVRPHENSRASPTRPSHPRLAFRDDRDTPLQTEAGWTIECL
jgi:hypothetical protein